MSDWPAKRFTEALKRRSGRAMGAGFEEMEARDIAAAKARRVPAANLLKSKRKCTSTCGVTSTGVQAAPMAD